MAEALAHLAVDEARMRANLDAAGGVARAEGLVAALAPHPRPARRVARWSKRRAGGPWPRAGRWQDVAADEPQVRAHLGAAEIVRALDPAAFTGSSRTFVDRVLARWQRGKG